jgi:hypothetical protein
MTASTPLDLLRETEQVLVKAFDAGIIGFTERPMAARLVADVRSGRGLDANDGRQAWRILARNEAALARMGLALPGRTQPEPAPAAQRHHADRAIELALRPDGRIDIRNSPMSMNESLKLGLYAQFHPATKTRPRATWSIPASPASAAGLLGLLADVEVNASARVRQLADQHMARMAAYERLHPDHPLPELEQRRLVLKPTLRDYQLRGVDFTTHAAASLLGFTMGGGKTATAIAAANQMEVKRGIILCPNKVRGVWPREVAKWSARSWHIVDGKRPPKRKGARYQDLSIVDRVHETEATLFDCTCGAQAHFAVWNYEMLAHAPASTWRPPEMLDLAIYDEVHRAKSPTGTVSTNLAEWVSFTANRIGLSGTPMPQYPWDIFGVYRALDPGIFGSLWTVFKTQYVFEAEEKAENVQAGRKPRTWPVKILSEKRTEFAEKVHSIMYRPTIKLDLPPLTDVERFVELEPAAAREYASLDKEMWADLSTFAGDWSEGDETLTPKNALSRNIRLMQFTGGTVPDDDFVLTEGEGGGKHRVSWAKENEIVEFAPKAKADGTHTITGGILDEIGCVPGHPGGPEPVIVYAHFKDEIEIIRQLALKAGLRYGEISGRRGDGLTETSELNPDIDICAVQISAGGTGVDLTRSRYGIWYSKGPSVGDYDQARARQHRHGQTRPVVFIHLYASGTVDLDVRDTIVKRRSLVAISCERRGLDPRAFGVDPNIVDPMPPAPDDMAQRSGGAVVLPIDEFGHSVMAPRKAHREVDPEGRVVADAATLTKYGLEDF